MFAPLTHWLCVRPVIADEGIPVRPAPLPEKFAAVIVPEKFPDVPDSAPVRDVAPATVRLPVSVRLVTVEPPKLTTFPAVRPDATAAVTN